MADDYGPEPKWAGLPKKYGPPYEPKWTAKDATKYRCTGCFRGWSRIDDFEAHICDGKARAQELRKIHEQQMAEVREEIKRDGVSPDFDLKQAIQIITDEIQAIREENFNLRVAVSDREVVLMKIRDLIDKELDGSVAPYLEED